MIYKIRKSRLVFFIFTWFWILFLNKILNSEVMIVPSFEIIRIPRLGCFNNHYFLFCKKTYS